MLSFTDEGLARLVIAASAIQPNRRGDWLRRLADRLEKSSARPLSPGARHMRALREREKAGRCVLKLEVDEVELAVALVDAGLLDPSIADDSAALAGAAQRALFQFCNGEASRRDREIRDNVRAELALTALQKASTHVSKRRS